MTVLGSLEVDGAVQAQLTNNDTGSQVEVLVDDLDELLGGLVRGAVGVDVDRQGLSNTNGVGELNKGAASEASVDEGLGDPASEISSGAVDLGEVLAREGTATVSTPATVGVDNDLTASQTGVTLGTTNDEETRGLNLKTILLACASVTAYANQCDGDLRGRWSGHRGTWREWQS